MVKKLRIFLAGVLVSGFIVVGAGPANAKCVGDEINPCVLICEVGQSSKYTQDLFAFCYVW